MVEAGWVVVVEEQMLVAEEGVVWTLFLWSLVLASSQDVRIL